MARQHPRENGSSALKTLTVFGLIVGILAGCIAIYQFAADQAEPPPRSTSRPTKAPATAPPTRRLSFLEQVQGNYTLDSWTATNARIELGAQVVEGSLTVKSSGIADWEVLVEQTHTSNPGQVRMTARGRVLLDKRQIAGVPGGDFNNTHHLDVKWVEVDAAINLAVRGWSTGEPEDPFTLTLDAQANQVLLQMRNSRGTYVWMKPAG